MGPAGPHQRHRDKTRDEAVAALFYAYRDYVLTNPEIYRVVLSLPQSESGTVEQAASTITKPVEYVLKGYDITKDQGGTLSAVLAKPDAWICNVGRAGIPCSFEAKS